MRIFRHAQRLWLLYRVFAARLGPRGYANLLGFSIRRFALRKKVPVSVMIALTYRCQCDCVHCAVSDAGRQGPAEMTTPEVKALIEDARHLGAIKIGFTGGEPLLRRDLVELVRHAYDNGLSNSIDTNGALLDRDMARRLKDAGVSNVNVSLDHPDWRRHDRLRRLPGCHAAAVRAIEQCVSVGIPCVVSTYVTDRSLREGTLDELVRLSRALGASAVRALFPIYSGKFARRGRPLLSLENQRLFFAQIADGSFVYSESPFFDFLSGAMECSMLKKLSVYVTPYGEVKTCYVSRRTIGDLRQRRLAEILESNSYFSSAPLEALGCQSC